MDREAMARRLYEAHAKTGGYTLPSGALRCDWDREGLRNQCAWLAAADAALAVVREAVEEAWFAGQEYGYGTADKPFLLSDVCAKWSES